MHTFGPESPELQRVLQQSLLVVHASPSGWHAMHMPIEQREPMQQLSG
jgi:hypothetical protein